MNEIICNIIDRLHNSDLSCLNNQTIELINNIALSFLNDNKYDKADIKNILSISNILYNNTDRNILPLEDGVYDLVLEKYKTIDPNYQVGAEPIYFNPTDQFVESKLKTVMHKLEQPNTKDFLYVDELTRSPGITKTDMYSVVMKKIDNEELISKRIVNTAHSYPKLVGTLDKCKFVLNKQAQDKGVFNDANVKVLERDFFIKHIFGLKHKIKILK